MDKQQTQQPVAWIERHVGGGVAYDKYSNAVMNLPEGVRIDLYTAPPVPRDVLMAFGEAVRNACYEAAMVRQRISGAKWDRFTAGKCAEAVSMVNTSAIADRYASQVRPELPSFDDVIAVQRREVMQDPSNAYMVGLHNGMAMMDANYKNSTDFECLAVQKQPEPVNQQLLAALRAAKIGLRDWEIPENRYKAQYAIDAAIAAAEAAQPVCQTCKGNGVIGGHVGQTPESFDYVTEDCPDCQQPASAQPVAVPDGLLSADDMKNLRRFAECCEDFESGGHDVPKAAMKRLELAGAVRSCGFGRHESTAFGDAALSAAQKPEGGE